VSRLRPPPERDKDELEPLDEAALRAFLMEVGGHLGEAFLFRAI
jgi:hypothetical protein